MDSSSLYRHRCAKLIVSLTVNEKEESTMKINRVSVDLAKNVFQLHGADHKGKTVWKRQLSRSKWLPVLCDTVEPGTEIGMEACAGAHHWARQLMQQGYPVKIIIVPVARIGYSGSVNGVMPIYAVYWFMVPVLRCARLRIKMID